MAHHRRMKWLGRGGARGAGSVVYDDWYLISFQDSARMRNNVDLLNSVLTANGYPILSGFYYTSTETDANRFKVRWMSSNSTADLQKSNAYKVKYARREIMADTSGYAVGDVAFGGIVLRVNTDVYLTILSFEQFNASQWANITDQLLGYTALDDGPENTAGIAFDTTTSVDQNALDYSFEM